MNKKRHYGPWTEMKAEVKYMTDVAYKQAPMAPSSTHKLQLHHKWLKLTYKGLHQQLEGIAKYLTEHTKAFKGARLGQRSTGLAGYQDSCLA